jgi:hypothetical protein
MRPFQSHEIFEGKAKSHRIDLVGDYRIDVLVKSPGTAEIYAVRGEQEHFLTSGQRVRFRGNLEGIDGIVIKSAKPPLYGIRASLIGGEYLDDEPAPVKELRPNLLAQMRENFRQGLGIMREEFASHSGHEIPDGDVSWEDDPKPKQPISQQKDKSGEEQPAEQLTDD